MAGLREVCSHVGGLLFYLLACSDHLQKFSTDACTSNLCSWLPPSAKKIKFQPLSEIDFTKPEKKFNQIKNQNQNVNITCTIKKKPIITEPTASEKALFFQNISTSSSNCAILSLIPEYSDNYIPLSTKITSNMDNLYCEGYEKLPYNQIVTLARRKLSSLTISPEESDFIEKSTHQQHQCKFWFKVRAGIITASNFKSTCHANISMPPKSLVLQYAILKKKNLQHLQQNMALTMKKLL